MIFIFCLPTLKKLENNLIFDTFLLSISQIDNTSEEIEFTRLGDYGDDISITSTTRSVRRTERTPKKGKKSELELLTEMATKPSFD